MNSFPSCGLVLCALGVAGCHATENHVIAVTGTSIGVDLSENPATGLPHARLGYYRGEVAIVPTNRHVGDTSTTGAEASADVLMELRYSNIFSSSGGIYQRLAVGRTAVSQDGAALMFARDANGSLAPGVAAALRNIPEVNTEVVASKAAINDAWLVLRASKGSQFEAAAKAAGFDDFEAFLEDLETTADAVATVRAELVKDPEIKQKIEEAEATRGNQD